MPDSLLKPYTAQQPAEGGSRSNDEEPRGGREDAEIKNLVNVMNVFTMNGSWNSDRSLWCCGYWLVILYM